jgi:predicted 2-oxoglutarate/Fe(II)-dependent dioxygenase YbiX
MNTNLFCNKTNYTSIKDTDHFLEKFLDDKKIITFNITNNKYDYECFPNIISNDVCDFIINESEKYAKNNSGWTTSRHSNYPTTDLPIYIIPNIYTLVNNLIINHVLPLIANKYNLNKYFLDFNDVFIVKYKYDEQSDLLNHRDGSVFSFNIFLNDPSEFKGGGTIFIKDDIENIIFNKKGGVIIHPGNILHGGNKITDGVRYILVGFVNYMKNIEYISNNKIESGLIKNKIDLKKFTINVENDVFLNLNNFIYNNCNSMTKLLNLKKEKFNILEKFIYDVVMYHFNRLNERPTPTGILFPTIADVP